MEVIAYCVRFVISKKEEDLALGPGFISQELLCSRVLLKYEKGQRKPLT